MYILIILTTEWTYSLQSILIIILTSNGEVRKVLSQMESGFSRITLRIHIGKRDFPNWKAEIGQIHRTKLRAGSESTPYGLTHPRADSREGGEGWNPGIPNSIFGDARWMKPRPAGPGMRTRPSYSSEIGKRLGLRKKKKEKNTKADCVSRADGRRHSLWQSQLRLCM